MNFFEWFRDGVKQSVLLGVNDAIEQIGTPPSGDSFHPNMVALLRENATDPTKSARGGNATGRRRLGKSLKDMNSPAG